MSVRVPIHCLAFELYCIYIYYYTHCGFPYDWRFHSVMMAYNSKATKFDPVLPTFPLGIFCHACFFDLFDFASMAADGWVSAVVPPWFRLSPVLLGVKI